MFTVGFFSTHLPYLAFVLFYAVFFFIGIEKASADEYGEGEQIFPKEISLTMDFQRDVDSNDFYEYNAYQKENINVLLFPVYWKITLKYSEFISIKSAVYLSSYFSRPPPAV